MVAPTRAHRNQQPDIGGGIRGLIRRHMLLSFFVLAFTLSWMAWTPYVLSFIEPEEFGFQFPVIMGTTQLLGVLPGAYLGPILSAFIVTAVAEGRDGLRRWGRRLVKWRVNWLWYVSVLFGVPALMILGTLPLPGALSAVQVPAVGILVAYVPFLLLQMVTTGLAEEPGWREFAIPHLQRRHGPLVGTLILAPLWGAWHLPLFLTEWGGWPDVDALRVGEFIFACVPISICMTWLFNRTGESLPVVMLFHASINNFFSVAWAPIFPNVDHLAGSSRAVTVGTGVLALILLAATRGRLGYQPPPQGEKLADLLVGPPEGARPAVTDAR